VHALVAATIRLSRNLQLSSSFQDVSADGETTEELELRIECSSKLRSDIEAPLSDTASIHYLLPRFCVWGLFFTEFIRTIVFSSPYTLLEP
jgi:hypothetical protein